MKLSSVLILIAIAAVHATNFAQTKRDLPNEVDDSRSLLPRPTLECLWEPVSMKQRCQTKMTNGLALVALVRTSFFWTGLNDLGSPRLSFSWVATGQPLGGYTNWSPGQPAGPATENCGEYMYRDAPRPAWNDRDCATPGRFICEVNLPCKCYV
ncbi:hypothetical protein B566_EDAN015357 [Ephemera danica]|nr:hypothetical protein B566_EDAN015357 [Ephemera danica]